MRTYIVQKNDSPASIAASMAGCPKCAVDLIAANPQKPAVRHGNGFVTFQSLHIGERLNIPDKWDNGQLDALPQEYFDKLPSHTGVSAAPKRSRAPIPVGGRGGRSGTCERWSLGASVALGTVLVPALNPNVSPAAYQQALKGVSTPYTMWIDGRIYLFQLAPPTPLADLPPTVQIYYCSRMSGRRLRPIGISGPPLPTPPPPGTIPTPTYSNVPQSPCCYTFKPQESYTLVVWPIPQSQGPIQFDPKTILTDLGFEVATITGNGDGSYTADVIYSGSANYTLDVNVGRGLLVFTDGAPVIKPVFGVPTVSNQAISIPGKSLTIDLPIGGGKSWWLTSSQWIGSGGAPLPPGTLIKPGSDITAPVTVALSGPTNLVGACDVSIPGGTPQSMQIFVTPNVGGRIFQQGETVTAYNGVGSVIGSAMVTGEYDSQSNGEGVLMLGSLTGKLGGQGITLVGASSGATALVKYQYGNVMVSPSGGLLGVSSFVDDGTSLQLPYSLIPGDTATMQLLPTTDGAGVMPDVTTIIQAAGLAFAGTAPLQNVDCSWTVTVTNPTNAPIEIDEELLDPSSSGGAFVLGLTVNGHVVVAQPPPVPPIAPPTMTTCHAFSMQFLSNVCQPIQGGMVPGSGTDPTAALSKLGITNAQLTLPGPAPSGEWQATGIWELGSGFTLPSLPGVTITGFQDQGPAVNVAQGPCATSLPFTVNSGDTVNMIVRPMATPGQPMTNPVAVLAALGFTNITPASTYSDCTWAMTATYAGIKSMQIVDPLLTPGVGGMWVVGLSVNGAVVKDANWTALQPIDGTPLESCHEYTVFFTFATCPALTGAPGSWDPTTALQAVLPNFKLAPGPNEYGEWSATGLYNGADGTPLQGSGGITFTWLVDYGKQSGCIPPGVVDQQPCASGQVKDLGTKACVAACPDGSAPTNGVCSTPTAGATAPVTTPSTTMSTGEIVGIGVGVVGLGSLAWWLLK